MVWPNKHWPAMKFKGGMKLGAKGGHGPIRYAVEKYDPHATIQFRFTSPLGFNGIHKFDVKELSDRQTEVTHVIDMKTNMRGAFIWLFAVKSLHNALVEDGLDKLENHFSEEEKSTMWNLWVRVLRYGFGGGGRN